MKMMTRRETGQREEREAARRHIEGEGGKKGEEEERKMSTLNVMLAKKEKLEEDLKLQEKQVRGREMRERLCVFSITKTHRERMCCSC